MGYSKRARVKCVSRQKHGSRPIVRIIKSNQHLSVVVASSIGQPITQMSTIGLVKAGEIKYGGNIEAASALAVKLSDKLKTLKIDTLAFNRSGWPYHGRIKAFVEKLRELSIII